MNRKCNTCGRVFSGEFAFCGEDGSVLVLDVLPDKADARLGQQLGAYVIAAPIADGATGRVYEGRHAGTREKVAVKILHAPVARDHVSVERFKREAEAGRLMSHPHIVTVIDFGQTGDGLHFMTMEFLDGEELGEVFRRKEKLSPEQIVRAICQIALALDYAHSFGFVHRDLKPDNIFLCRGEHGSVIKILDFGSVKVQVDLGPKLTAIGTTLGSPFYMSPEQAMGKQDLDQRSDVFALGSILYEMLTNEVAFGAPNVAEVLMKILQGQPTPPSAVSRACPASMDAVVARALEKDKTMRYGTAMDLARAVCQAFRIDVDVERWAHAQESDISQALAARRRPSLAAPALFADAGNMPKNQAVRLATTPEFDDAWMSSAPGVPTRSHWVPVLAAVAGIGMLAALALFWLNVL